MTILLILAMVLAIAVCEAHLARRRARAARAAERAITFLAPSTHPPEGALMHPGHTWVLVHGEDLATVGSSAFASGFAGKLNGIRLPREGRRLRQAQRACTLVSEGEAHERVLDLPAPIDGTVLAVNSRLKGDPGLVQRQPYGEGWLYRVRPRRLGTAVRNLLPAPAARGWLEASRARLCAQLEPCVGTLLNDGGELQPAFGHELTDEAWEHLRRELFAMPDDPLGGRS